MAYQRRLQAAAKFIENADRRAAEELVIPEELGVTATLKPHQVEGVSWLVRRYFLGVNVVLGLIFILLNLYAYDIRELATAFHESILEQALYLFTEEAVGNRDEGSKHYCSL
ncbi:hypothetical protein F8388_008983 [Cannabis sativa]|uniref:Uncharacterized protein n=1 Tax=Cannabis sativa TaxID=3483 RepID=A0A7J6GG55_CANSA|nr:hypothetical protein F8388_008983 [Cannabis sativa]